MDASKKDIQQAAASGGTASEIKTKAEALAAERKAKRDAKAAEKTARKAANAAKRADGVIGTLHKALLNPYGTTRKEILDHLATKFTERDPLGMATTVGIQLSRLQKKNGKIVSRSQPNRGVVYGYEQTVQFAPESSNGAPSKTEIVAKAVEQTPPATPAPSTTPKSKGGKKR